MLDSTADSAHDIAYALALAVHIVVAVTGFGVLALSGLYGARGRHLESREDLRDLTRYFDTSNWASRAIWAVPITGGIALWLDRGVAALGEAWAIAASVCWAAALLLAVLVIWPAERRIGPIVAQLEEAPVSDAAPPGRAALAESCGPLVWAAAFCDLAFTVALALMVLQPGR